jgi:hypothetical protein
MQNQRRMQMSTNLEIFPSVQVEQHQTKESKEKEKRMLEYIRELRMIEEEMEPFKEQKRDLKAQFKEAGWLTGDEISMTVKAYRMLKSKDFDLNEFTRIYQTLSNVVGEN